MPFKLMSDLGNEIAYSRSVFAGGEIQIRIDPDKLVDSAIDLDQITITAHMREASDVMELAMLANTVSELSWGFPRLVMPYLPYARQDRACRLGEDFSLRTFSTILNSLGFESITVWDVHSDVAFAEIEGLENIEADHFVRKIKFDKPPIVVAPDKGAKLRAGSVANVIGNGFIQALKERSEDNSRVTTRLEDLIVARHITTEDLLIVDDICDGGRTFIELAKILRPLITQRTDPIINKSIGTNIAEIIAGTSQHLPHSKRARYRECWSEVSPP